MDGSPVDSPAALVRARLDAGAGYEEVLALLRARGLEKWESMRLLEDVRNLSHGDAKSLVHFSSVWSDRRQGDEDAEEAFFRVLFIMAVLGEAEVSEPLHWRVEVDERRQRARVGLHHAAGCLPNGTPPSYRDSLAGGRFGESFAALVEAGERQGISAEGWRTLAGVSASTSCLMRANRTTTLSARPMSCDASARADRFGRGVGRRLLLSLPKTAGRCVSTGRPA